MTKKKEILLKKAMDKVYGIGFALEPIDELEEYFAEKLMVIGTTVDEKFSTLDGLRTLIKHQKEQSAGLDVSFTRKEIFRDFPGNEDVAIIVEDVGATIKTNNDSLYFDMRSTAVLEFVKDQWKLVHWHASKPELVQPETDIFGIEDWKQKTDRLEKLVAERTADLEKKNRDLEIEASLERVRTIAMAMQQPRDMLSICEAMGNELSRLDIKQIRNIQTAIFYPNKGTYLNYEYYAKYNKPVVTEVQYTGSHIHDDHKKFAATMLQGEGSYYTRSFEGEELRSWYQYQEGTEQLTDQYLLNAHSLNYYMFSLGTITLGISTYYPLTEDELSLFKRFSNVFNLAYRRYLDIETAEVNAREAKIEAALEKVRSRTLAMHKSDELSETAAEVFRQLIALGIEPNRLYIGIVQDEGGDMEMWATDEDGSKIGSKFIFNKDDNASVMKLYQGWLSKEKSVIVDMQGKELEEYFHYLHSVLHIPFKGGLAQKRRVQTVAYFSKGFIGMASPDGQGNETKLLLERFAAVFNLTFTRFNDLKIAEAHALQAEQDLEEIKSAKQKAEQALADLQVTQKQLIQSEKMASLGELTAGIAHEIQNPLNFVNNFSEINNELIEELKSQKEKVKTEELDEILDDIFANNEKINYHGKRADAIVKGMLQHSRTGSSVKETTDINMLCDEYLRLAYHGLRAKDKSFNAKFETDFDNCVGELNIIAQEIGRVILNLINNAFYAVSKKQKFHISGYEPTVKVSTKKAGDKILISVEDNGEGIPQNILDKIFQPFFTTKPAGQGTGLGLSLSYDIITKGHGGELTVNSQPGEGSRFIIQLNANS